MKKSIIILIAAGFLLTLGTWNPASAEEGAQPTGQQLFETNCKMCHPIERPRSKRKTREGWETTVKRMKNINGAPISDEEASLIINYLTETYGK
jgi:mono/diheme cytochrome c family protein